MEIMLNLFFNPVIGRGDINGVALVVWLGIITLALTAIYESLKNE